MPPDHEARRQVLRNFYVVLESEYFVLISVDNVLYLPSAHTKFFCDQLDVNAINKAPVKYRPISFRFSTNNVLFNVVTNCIFCNNRAFFHIVTTISLWSPLSVSVCRQCVVGSSIFLAAYPPHESQLVLEITLNGLTETLLLNGSILIFPG